MNDRITIRFADTICNFTFDKMPKDVIIQAKRILLDTLGVTLAATSSKYSAGRILTELVKIEGGNPECSFSNMMKPVQN